MLLGGLGTTQSVSASVSGIIMFAFASRFRWFKCELFSAELELSCLIGSAKLIRLSAGSGIWIWLLCAVLTVNSAAAAAFFA